MSAKPSPHSTASSASSSSPTFKERLRRIWTEHKRAIVIAAIILILLPLAWGRVDFARLHERAEHLDPGLLFAALVLLPLVTVPVTPLNILAGIRFGLAGGLAVVAASIVCQHLLAYLTARVLPAILRRKLEPLRERLPRHAHSDATVFTSLLPGAPYWAQLYVLPLIGVPLTTYVVLSSVLHTIRSVTAVIAGKVSEHPSMGWGIALLVYGTLLAIACFLAGRRMTRKYHQHHRAPSS